MKQWILFLIITAFVNQLSYAINAPFYGVYTGGSIGSAITYTNEKASFSAMEEINSGELSLSMSMNEKVNRSKNTLIAYLYTGFGHTWRRFYLGGEIALTATNYKMRSQFITSIDTSISDFFEHQKLNEQTILKLSPIQFTATMRPGILLTPNTLSFLRFGLGLANSSYRVFPTLDSRFNISALGLNETLPTVFLQHTNKKRHFFPQVGFGLEQYISPKWTVRMDYVYSYYGRHPSSVSDSITRQFTSDLMGTLSLAASNQIKMQSQTFLIGTTFHLDLI